MNIELENSKSSQDSSVSASIAASRSINKAGAQMILDQGVAAPGLGKTRLMLQWLLDRIFFIPFPGLLLFTQRYILGIKVKNVPEVRRYYRELLKDKTPLLICSNHLTYIDSVILIEALNSTLGYVWNFRSLPWNLPAANYRSNPFFRMVGLFSKCIFIDRDGTREDKEAVLSSARWLMSRGEPAMIFPEGRRSKTGRFDDGHMAYGIGKILSGLPECRVLCCYLRAGSQESLSKMPAKGSKFDLTFDLVHFDGPRLASADAVASTTQEIATRIKKLELAYFGEPSAKEPTHA